MPWPVPAPGDIAARGAAVFEQALPGIDARSPNTVATTITRVNELTLQDLYFYQAYLAKELFANTAVDYLPLHAVLWGVPRQQPLAASGNVLVSGGVNIPFPAGVSLAAGGQTYVSTAAVTTSNAGTASVPVQASLTGVAGNLSAGTVLTITSPVPGIYPQTGVVDGNGITGGEDLESVASWRARIVAKIQQPAMGGDENDYIDWVQTALPEAQYVSPIPNLYGLGTVGVPFLMAGAAVPTQSEINQVQAYLNTVRPVTAQVTAFAAAVSPVNITLHLNPDTTAIRAAATAALQLAFENDAKIGGTTYYSRINNAVAASDGEFSHEMISPTADVAAPSDVTMNVLGTVTFQ